MLLYHGTHAEVLESILREGLRPPQPDATAHDWLYPLAERSRDTLVFLATEPVAGKGGDPVSFALGWPMKRWRYPRAVPGYLIVVDLPPDALHLVRAVVPNYEFNQFVQVADARRSLLRHAQAEHDASQSPPRVRTWRLTSWCMLSWLWLRFARHHIPLELEALREQLELVTYFRDPALPADLTPHRWRAFVDEYGHLVEVADGDTSPTVFERRRHALLLRHGITLPQEVEEDAHRRYCRLCVNGYYTYGYRVSGLESDSVLQAFLRTWQRRRGGTHPMHGTELADTMRLPAFSSTTLGARGDHVLTMTLQALRVLGAYHAACGEEAIARFFLEHETGHTDPWEWDAWYTAFPNIESGVPAVWRPGYGRDFTPGDLKRPDRQVLVDAVPARSIVGAIRLSDGVRLAPRVRPNRRRGETLASVLHRLALDLRTSYRGTPLILD